MHGDWQVVPQVRMQKGLPNVKYDHAPSPVDQSIEKYRNHKY